MVPALGSDASAAGRGLGRGSACDPRACLDHYDTRDIRASDQRGRPQGAGRSGLVHRTAGVVVTDGLAIGSTIRLGLLGRLMAAVRPEFRADELVFDPADPVFGGG